MAKYDSFNQGKYHEIFDQMYGQGARERGINSAKETGRLKVEASLARKEYEARRKAEEAARKKAEKEKAKAAATALPKADSYERTRAKKPAKNDDGILGKLIGGVKKVGSEISRFDDRMVNAMTLGLSGEADKRIQKKIEAPNVNLTKYLEDRKDGDVVGKGLDIASTLAGYVVPGVGATQLARGLGATGKGINALAQASKAGNVTKPLLKKAAVDAAKEGAMIGGGLATAESAIRLGLNKESNTTAGAELKNIALGTLLGGALDPLATIAGPAAKMLARDTVNKGTSDALSEVVKRTTTKSDPASVGQQQLNEMLFGRPNQSEKALNQLTRSQNAPDFRNPLETMASQTNRNAPSPMNSILDASDEAVATSPLRQAMKNAEGTGPTRPVSQGNPDFTVVDRTVKKPKADPRGALTKAQQQFTSDVAPLRQIDKEIQNLDADGMLEYLKPKTLIPARTKDLATANSAERSMLNAKGARSVAANHTTSRFEPFMKNLNASAATDSKAVGDYAANKHTLTLMENAADNKALRDGMIEEIDALKVTLGDNSDEVRFLQEMLDDFKDYTPPANATVEDLQAAIAKAESNPETVKFYNEFMELQQQNLKDMHEGGMLTDSLYNKLKENKTYVRMSRNFDDPAAATGGASRRVQNPLDRMKQGSEEMIKDPIQGAMRNAYMTKFNIEKNKALGFVEKFAAVDKQGVLFRGVTEPNASTITMFKNGKPKHFEVPPELKHYVDNFNPDFDPDILTNVMQKAAQVQRKLTTQYNLAFQLKSLVREPVQAIMTSRTAPTALHAAKNTALGYVDALVGPQLQEITKGLPKRLQFNSYKQNWDKLGGTGFQYMDVSDESLNRMAKEMMEGGTAKGNIKHLNPFRSLAKFGEKVEEGARLGEFRSAKNQGYADADAFFEATDITNYKRSGNVTRELNKYVPFLNATIQGNSRVLRAFQEAPERTILRGATMLSTAAIGAYSMRFHDGVSDEQRRELDNLSQWEKDAYMHIPVPNSETIIAIPKAFAVGQMFMNPVERALDDYYNAVLKEESVPDHVKQGLISTAKSFIPPYEFAGATTLYELKQNRSLFSGQDIESQFDRDAGVPKQHIEAYDQSWLTGVVSDLINKMSFSSDSEGIVSPAQVDYFIKDLTGTTGKQTLGIMDSLITETAPSKPLSDSLLKPVKQFEADPTRASGVYAELQKLAKKEKRDNNSMTGMSEEEKNAERASRPLQNYESAFKDINKEIQAVRSSKSLTSQEKKKAITELRKQQDSLGTQAIDWYNSLQ